MSPAAAARRVVLLSFLCALLAVGPGCASRTESGWFGDTITVPCGRDIPANLAFGKWKYENPDGTTVFLAHRKNTTVKYESVPEYAGRLRLWENYSLSIDNAKLGDEKRLVCMLVTEDTVYEEPTLVKVFKAPSGPVIQNKAAFLQVGELVALGECVARDSYPEGTLAWQKDGKTLAPSEGSVLIEARKEQDPGSQLYTVKSTLRYMASKDSAGAQLSCSVTYQGPAKLNTATSDPAAFEVHYPTEKLTLDTLPPPTRAFKEGDNITLKCTADGNPPPKDFVFYIPGKDGGTLSPSVFVLTNVKRNDSGEYMCALADKANLTSPATAITVHYLDLSMTPSGAVTQLLGGTLQVTCTASSSQNVPVVWMKDGVKLPSKPSFTSLQYQDTGKYACQGTLDAVGIKKNQTLNVTVEGKPRLVKVTKEANKDGKTKTVTCHVEGYPKPVVRWNSSSSEIALNDTKETDYVNWRFASKLTISPTENLTLTCIAENKVERSMSTVNVFALDIPEPDEPDSKDKDDHDQRVSDQAKLVVGIVVGLLLAALVAGLAYWLYSREQKKGAKSEVTRPSKELGNGEETKALEEKNHTADA